MLIENISSNECPHLKELFPKKKCFSNTTVWSQIRPNIFPVRFSVVWGGAKSRVVTISMSPQGGPHTRALKSEMSLSQPIPVGGGAVDTNDWCIILYVLVER